MDIHGGWMPFGRFVMSHVKALLCSLGLVLPVLLGGVVFSPLAVAAETTARSMETAPAQDSLMSKILPGFQLSVENAKQLVTLQKADGSAYVMMQLLKPVPYKNTLAEYARHVMQYYHGTNLTPQPQRRGYSFSYQDSAPCAGLVTFFDGASYLMMGVCGKLSQDEVTKSLNIAKKQLGLDELIFRSSMPKVYY